ncbi:hypothetical protein BUALT_Bualt11G0043500 [Buddleja alternifolia]|uniref:Calmodulin-lysine N-methyltransferase n=1 Tax=Buddleja alternifolia TaxID=168488 RepID=A0AAV6WTT7_9LAMI|nr:hypothetical protein BUALT_Bualt11G0043500 [Buddleja alternifolia]
MDPNPSSLRWQILRRALLRRSTFNSENPSEKARLNKVSRRTSYGFNLIPCNVVNELGEDSDSDSDSYSDSYSDSRDACLCYTLPLPNAPKLLLRSHAISKSAFEFSKSEFQLTTLDLSDGYEPSSPDCEAETTDGPLLSKSASSGQSIIRTPFRRLTQQEFTELRNKGQCFWGGVAVHLLGRPMPQRKDATSLFHFLYSSFFVISNTRLGQWPSEEVLAYYSISHLGSFRNKRVIELGSGYGLAGLVIAMVADASEVVISDGNPQVVNYANSASFGGTKVKSMLLHWDQNEVSDICGTFDVIVASDCTFFKEFHKSFARTIRYLLKDGPSEAILFSPKRGDSLKKFLLEVENSGLHFTTTEMYDTEIWSRHQNFIKGDHSWLNYDSDHCYPLLVEIKR